MAWGGGQGHASSPVVGPVTAPRLCPHPTPPPMGQAGGDALPWAFPAAPLQPCPGCPWAGMPVWDGPKHTTVWVLWGSLPDATLELPFGGLLRCPGCASCCTESLPAWLLIQIRADVNTGVMFSGMISDCLLLPVPMVINAVPLHAIVLLNTYTRGCFHRG